MRTRGQSVQQRMPDVIDAVTVFFVKIFFKGQDDEHPVYVFLYAFHATLFPCPYLRGNVVIRAVSVFAAPGCYVEVEARIVHEYDSVRCKSCDIAFTELHVTQDSAQVCQHFGETHKGQFAVVFYYFGSRLPHQIAAPCAYFGLSVTRFEFFY